MTDTNKPKEDQKAQEPAQVEDWQKKYEELEGKHKEQGTKIQELETTLQTINKRFEAPTPNQNTPDEDEVELREIETMRGYDPDGAAKKHSQYLKKRDERIAKATADRLTAQQNQQNIILNLRNGVKSSNPEFDDDVVDYVIQRAEVIAASGKVKTAVEAVNEAAKFVKSKFEAFASKSKVVPPLPPGSGAEGGGNPTPSTPPVDKVEEPSEFVENMRSAKEKKIL